MEQGWYRRMIFCNRFFWIISFISHGIGHFLGVHEGPQRIASGYSEYEEALADGMFLSDEPGFYKAGEYAQRRSQNYYPNGNCPRW